MAFVAVIWTPIFNFRVFSSVDIRFRIMSTFTTKDSPPKKTRMMMMMMMIKDELTLAWR